MRNIVILLLVAVLLVFLYYTYYIVPSANNNLLGISLNGNKSHGINFISGSRGSIGVGNENFSNPAPLDYSMGEYSNIALNKDDKMKYDKLYHMYNESDELIETPYPCDSFECKHNMVPSVDGCEKSPKSAAMFKFNKSSPECCPSPYSTSSGCVCLTPEQKNYISYNRGNNSK